MGTNDKPVCVVGGGISGLAAAYYLRKRGRRVTLIEQEPRVGGLIQTVPIDGCLIEAGPDSFLAAKPAALELVRDLGLSADVIDSNDHQRVTYIVRNGRLVAMPDGLVMMAPTKLGPLLRTPLLSWGAKLQAAKEYFRRPGAPLPDRSVAAFVRDHFGEEAVRYLAEPLLSGVFGGDVEKLSARHVLTRFVALEESDGSVTRGLLRQRRSAEGSLFKSLRGGMEQLTIKLAEKLRDTERIQGAVEAIETGPRLKIDGSWMDAKAVVLAVRAWQAAPVLRSLDSELARLLSEIEYSSAVTVGLTYSTAGFPHPLKGFGFLVPAVERRNISACTWVTRKFDHRTAPDRLVLRAFLGGDRWCNATDTEILNAVYEDLRLMMKLDVRAHSTAIWRWPRSMPQYFVGHYDRVEAIRRCVSQIEGVHLAGNYFDGVGIPDCIRRAKEISETI